VFSMISLVLLELLVILNSLVFDLGFNSWYWYWIFCQNSILSCYWYWIFSKNFIPAWYWYWMFLELSYRPGPGI
jgi:hypothetical protein